MRFLLAIVLCLVATLTWAETRVAFIIGNSAYETVSPLDNPINDAQDMTVALEGLGFRVILGSDATMDEMRRGIDAFATAKMCR